MTKKSSIDKPIVHFTKHGDRYVYIDDLFRSEAARKAIADMARIGRKKDTSNIPRKIMELDRSVAISEYPL